MAGVTEEYQRLVLDDIKNYGQLYHPLKAGFLERLILRKLPLSKLHPNPQDEFSSESIGPNYGIVSRYEKKFLNKRTNGNVVDNDPDDPIYVEKISTGGYMILNGHHRWLAAKRINLGWMPVRIVNVTTEEEVLATVASSDRELCASIDLDEVLLTDGTIYPAQKKLLFPFNRVYKKSLRKNVAILIRELRRIGFDVWVYTGEYYSNLYINTLFRLHGAKVDGIINGVKRKGTMRDYRKAFTDKYRTILHIDNHNVICVKKNTKEYEIYPIDSEHQDWASEVIMRLKENKEYWHECDKSIL